jgi:hypothetical protein
MGGRRQRQALPPGPIERQAGGLVQPVMPHACPGDGESDAWAAADARILPCASASEAVDDDRQTASLSVRAGFRVISTVKPPGGQISRTCAPPPAAHVRTRSTRRRRHRDRAAVHRLEAIQIDEEQGEAPAVRAGESTLSGSSMNRCRPGAAVSESERANCSSRCPGVAQRRGALAHQARAGSARSGGGRCAYAALPAGGKDNQRRPERQAARWRP